MEYITPLLSFASSYFNRLAIKTEKPSFATSEKSFHSIFLPITNLINIFHDIYIKPKKIKLRKNPPPFSPRNQNQNQNQKRNKIARSRNSVSRNFLERGTIAWRETRREKRNRDESRGVARSNPGFFQPRMSSLPKRGVLVVMVTSLMERGRPRSVGSREGDEDIGGGRGGVEGQPGSRRCRHHHHLSSVSKTKFVPTRLLHATFFILSFFFSSFVWRRSDSFHVRKIFFFFETEHRFLSFGRNAWGGETRLDFSR